LVLAPDDTEKQWLASGRMFSSNGLVESFPKSLQFARRLPDGSYLAATRSRLLRFNSDGSVKLTAALEEGPSATPVLGARDEVLVPTVEGGLLRALPDGTSSVYARLGYSPVSELVLDRARQRLLAAVGEGQVCAVSLSRRAQRR
jgi:hypothetical protein